MEGLSSGKLARVSPSAQLASYLRLSIRRPNSIQTTPMTPSSWTSSARWLRTRLLVLSFSTDDGNAADTARHVGLRVIDLPFDEPGNARWRLDPEPDGVQRSLNEMERRLNLVMKQGPDLRIAFRDTSGNEVDQLQIEAVHYPPLQSSEVDELLGRVAALHPSPEFSLPSVGDPMLLHGLSDAARQQNYRAAAYLLLPDTKAIRRYEEVERPTWLGKVRERLEHAHWLLSLEHNQIALAIQLENRGSVPARSLLVRLQARGRAMLCLPPGVSKVPGPGLDELLLRLPAPPTPPKPRSSFLEDLSGLNLFHRTDGIPEPEMRRDPRALYWRSEHKGLRQDWEIECSEFQHQDVPKGVAFRLVIGPGAARHGNCAVECTVQAGNQPEPRTARLPVHIVWTEGDTIERIERMFSDPGSVKFDKEGHKIRLASRLMRDQKLAAGAPQGRDFRFADTSHKVPTSHLPEALEARFPCGLPQ